MNKEYSTSQLEHDRETEAQETVDEVCGECQGLRSAHRGYECNCRNHELRAYWAPLENLPGYLETREQVIEWERNAPRPCPCRSFVSIKRQTVA